MNFPHAAKIGFNCQKNLHSSYHKNFTIYIHGFIFYFLSKYSLVKYCAKTTIYFGEVYLNIRKYWHYIRNFQNNTSIVYHLPKISEVFGISQQNNFFFINTHPGFFPGSRFELFQQFLYFKWVWFVFLSFSFFFSSHFNYFSLLSVFFFFC